MLADVLHGFPYRLLGDNVRVEGKIDRPSLESDIVPVCQKSNAPELIFALKSPNTGDGDGAGPFSCQGISLLGTLGNPQRNLGISNHLLAARRTVETI